MALTKPVRVSGIIKLLRWSFLVYGIYYGKNKWIYYHRIQTKLRDEREKEWPYIKERKGIEKLEKITREIVVLAKELNIELPPDWKSDGFYKSK